MRPGQPEVRYGKARLSIVRRFRIYFRHYYLLVTASRPPGADRTRRGRRTHASSAAVPREQVAPDPLDACDAVQPRRSRGDLWFHDVEYTPDRRGLSSVCDSKKHAVRAV